MINAQGVDGLRPLKDSTITYDVMGNPESYLGKTLSWEGKQLTSVIDGTHSYSYSYNEDGLRLRKVVGGTDTEYYYNGSVLMYMITGSGSTAIRQRFSYDAAGNLVAVVYKVGSGTSYIYYYLRNAQGDIVKLIDNTGLTVVEYTYDSWGKPIGRTGSLSSSLGKDQPFRYRGYVYDEETGFYYLQSRYYDPTTCRFISADVLLSTGQGVIGHNSFAYCRSNPIARRDCNGKEDEEIWPDYTQEVLDLLLSNYNEAQVWALFPIYSQISFYDHVRPDGLWDYKSHRTEWMPDDDKISFFCINMTSADLGNLNYGMTGMVCGFSRRTLLTAAGAVAIMTDGDNQGFEFYYDGADDYFFINLGVTIAEVLNPRYAFSSAVFDLTLSMEYTGRKVLSVINKAHKMAKLLPKKNCLLTVSLPY